MTKIICTSLEGGLLQSNTYRTPKGNEYNFNRGCPTEIVDQEDVRFFLSCGDGTLFITTNPVKEAVQAVKDKVKEAVGKQEKVEKMIDGIPNIKYAWTEQELTSLSKREQIELIKRLSGSNTRLPNIEKERVALLAKLLKEKK